MKSLLRVKRVPSDPLVPWDRRETRGTMDMMDCLDDLELKEILANQERTENPD